jgi:hypothetical protein
MFGNSQMPRHEQLLRAGYRPLFQSAHSLVFALEDPCPTGVGRSQ